MATLRARVVLAVAVVGLTACTGTTDGPTNDTPPAAPTTMGTSTTAATPTGAVPRPSSATTRPATTPAPDVRETFAALERRLGVDVGVAWAPVGGGGGRARATGRLGSWQSGPAWSTIKVPLAVAALRADDAAGSSPGGGGQADVARAVRLAIRASDNEAAARLWEGLGSPDEAGTAVEAVLREGGDGRTRVQTRHTAGVRYSAMGQTRWSLIRQARWVAGLAEAPDDDERVVLSHMGHLTVGGEHGLGTIAGARFKGGWGPGDPRAQTGMTCRQMGVIPGQGGEVAVTLGTTVDTMAHCETVLDALATWAEESVGAHAPG